jgi:hypothetical protein
MALLGQPEGLQHALLMDYFDLSFTTLPHKVLMPDKFEDEVKKLRGRFMDRWGLLRLLSVQLS